MKDGIITRHISLLCQRVLADSGFAHQLGGSYRSDATAWAVVALTAADTNADLADAARVRLAADQQREGRIRFTPENPEAFWPTPLAVLAWNGAPQHRSQQELAARFLLNAFGSPPPGGMDVTQKRSPEGWPWIAGTHTWVEPTALSLLALRCTGYDGHQRCREGEQMLMQRQLPHGGWNCGSTVVYGQELRPQPDASGVALAALAGRVPREEIEKSICYLKERVAGLRTPFSLAWSLLGLGAWGERPVQARRWIAETFSLQEKYGSYDTTLLSLLLLAYLDKVWSGSENSAGGFG